MTELVLSDGKRAVIRDGKGRDILNAQRKARTTDEVIYALIAELTEIEDKKIVYEDVLDMPLQDVMALMGVFGNFTQSLQGTSSPSADIQAGA